MFQGMEYVYAVYQEKNFSKAAAKLYISQPSLSANIKRIEKKIGYPLFDRSTKPLSLTECGEQYIAAVEQIMSITHEFETFIGDFGELRTGSLHFGGSNFFSSWVLPPMLSAFSEKYPKLEISLTEAKSRELVTMLQNSQIDFILDNKELDLNVFERHHVGKEDILLVVPKRNPLNQELKEFQIPLKAIRDGSFRDSSYAAVDLSRFEDESFIILHSFNDTGNRARLLCQEYGFKPQIALELDQQLTAYNVAGSGLACTFSGELMISRSNENPNVVYYKLQGKNVTRNIYFYWKKGRYLSQAMRVFMDTAMKDIRL
jgi:DNA-binding transcriptional LysR family regulator